MQRRLEWWMQLIRSPIKDRSLHFLFSVGMKEVLFFRMGCTARARATIVWWILWKKKKEREKRTSSYSVDEREIVLLHIPVMYYSVSPFFARLIGPKFSPDISHRIRRQNTWRPSSSTAKTERMMNELNTREKGKGKNEKQSREQKKVGWKQNW